MKMHCSNVFHEYLWLECCYFNALYVVIHLAKALFSLNLWVTFYTQKHLFAVFFCTTVSKESFFY